MSDTSRAADEERLRKISRVNMHPWHLSPTDEPESLFLLRILGTRVAELREARAEIEMLRAVAAPDEWRPISKAPRDGFGFLAYGRHAHSDGRPGRYKQGDHWWAIIQWDTWREPHQFVFGKDGEPVTNWGEPLLWRQLPPPPAVSEEGEG